MLEKKEATMIKLLKIFLIAGGFFFLFSCENSSSQQEITSVTEASELVKIQTEVKMIPIKGGKYQPFYGEDSTLVEVNNFLLDERQVTNNEFLEFVKKNPQWKRSNVKAIFADETYLQDWQDDETLPKNANPDAPVTMRKVLVKDSLLWMSGNLWRWPMKSWQTPEIKCLIPKISLICIMLNSGRKIP